jgi:hypothetical protein
MAGIWAAVVVTCLNALSENSTGAADKNAETPEDDQSRVGITSSNPK